MFLQEPFFSIRLLLSTMLHFRSVYTQCCIPWIVTHCSKLLDLHREVRSRPIRILEHRLVFFERLQIHNRRHALDSNRLLDRLMSSNLLDLVIETDVLHLMVQKLIRYLTALLLPNLLKFQVEARNFHKLIKKKSRSPKF